MPPYDVFMHLDLLESIPGRGLQRRRIMDFVRFLRDHPDTRGDFTGGDPAHRGLQVKIIGGYAVVYWVDEAVRAIMIADIRSADR